MKKIMKGVMIWGMMMASSFMAQSQTKMDEQRMEQDIEVAENILSTMIRQQLGKRNFFPMEVNGSYTAGYGVTFRMPRLGAFTLMTENFIGPNMTSFSYSFNSDFNEKEERQAEFERDNAVRGEKAAVKARTAVRTPKGYKVNRDSLAATADQIFLMVAKNFLADYGDVISQLKPEERITITNRSEDFEGGMFLRWPEGEARRGLMSAEVKREDINQMKQGKITRDQFLSLIKIINTESSGELDPDLEVLSSMFSRLYREDLSKTYYVQGEVSYERLRDFGVIYYMRVYSSNEEDDRFFLPTVGLRDVSQLERDKKVKELYPKFESDLKENLVEYGRTLRSLKDEEQVLFKVKLTKCDGCGIPETLELSIKNSVLKDYGSGKVSKEAALAKVNVKKSGEQ